MNIEFADRIELIAENTQNNGHVAAALVVASTWGNETDVTILSAIQREQEELGHMPERSFTVMRTVVNAIREQIKRENQELYAEVSRAL